MAIADRNTFLNNALQQASALFGSRAIVDPSSSRVRIGRQLLALESQPHLGLGMLSQLANNWTPNEGRARRVLVVPQMTRNGEALCEQAGIPWFDLAGNAEIDLPQLRVHVRGRRHNAAPRKTDSAFAPTASRIVRLLLLDLERSFTQKELVAQSNLAQGFVSKILRDLLDKGFVTKEKRAIRVRDPNILLQAWQEQYRFDKHEIIRGHLPARTGEALLQSLSKQLTTQQIEHAATGLAGAWLWSEFAMFRLTTIYVRERPDTQTWHELGFRSQDNGANVWLVVPSDEGVFERATQFKGVPCVSALQVYLDLPFQPERADEAAEQLRTRALAWIKPHA